MSHAEHEQVLQRLVLFTERRVEAASPGRHLVEVSHEERADREWLWAYRQE